MPKCGIIFQLIFDGRRTTLIPEGVIRASKVNSPKTPAKKTVGDAIIFSDLIIPQAKSRKLTLPASPFLSLLFLLS
jgi:hypothetical protein